LKREDDVTEEAVLFQLFLKRVEDITEEAWDADGGMWCFRHFLNVHILHGAECMRNSFHPNNTGNILFSAVK
jgi:hypothetical protein